MAAHGRNGDSMLVHMTPGEVNGLQALAVSQGKSMTINPHTGLPEASWLEDTLKKVAAPIAGAALAYFAPELMGTFGSTLFGAAEGSASAAALGAGATVGGATALGTGDLGKGLQAGLGAWGGAGLYGSLAGDITGAEAGMGSVADQSAAENARLIRAEAANPENILSGRTAEDIAAEMPATGTSALQTKLQAAAANPAAFAKANWKPIAAAALPILMENQTTTQMPNTGSSGYIRPHYFNPYTKQVEARAPVLASEFGARSFPTAKEGGLMSLAKGGVTGYAPGGMPTSDFFDTPAAPAAPTYSDQQIQAAIDASRAQGFNNDQIRQGAQANYGVDVSRFLNPVTTAPAVTPAPVVTTAPTGGLDTLAANQAATGSTTATTALNNTGITPVTTTAAVTPAETTAATPAVDQQALAITTVQNGIDAGKTPAEIAATVNTQYGKNFTAQNVRDFAYANGLETVKPALTTDQYVAQNKIQEGQFGGLGSLNAQQQQELALAEAKKGISAGLSDTDIAKLVDAKYVKGFTTQNVTDFIKANKLLPINQPPNSTVIGDGTGVFTDTGKILPISTLKDGTQVVVNPTQVATNAVTAPTNLSTTDRNTLPVGVSGNQTATINPNGTVSMTTGTPGAPVGGYTGIQSLVDAYTKGGGSTGYIPYAPKTMAEFNAKYTNTGGSKQAYDYLMGKAPYPVMPYTPHGQIAVPYGLQSGFEQPGANSRYTYNAQAGTYAPNPNYVPVSYDKAGNVQYGNSQSQITSALKGMAPEDAAKWGVDNGVSPDEVAMALGVPLSTIIDAYTKRQAAKSSTTGTSTTVDKIGIAEGGEIYVGGMAQGGQAQYNLGSYSDGGRLLRGPGDGVSDSIPATIGHNQPARLADGEFVVPARIVSELGNGSTEAGARKLYQMMARVQNARGKTVGKNRVATNTRADKYLPA
jgi:hypothetical protein